MSHTGLLLSEMSDRITSKKNPGGKGPPGHILSGAGSVRQRSRLWVRWERRIVPGATQEFQGRIERLIVFGLRRDVRLRAALLVALRLEVAAQRRFALGFVRPRFHFLRHILQHFDVGGDALGLDRTAGRCEIPRRRQPQRAIAGAERNDGLYRTL